MGRFLAAALLLALFAGVAGAQSPNPTIIDFQRMGGWNPGPPPGCATGDFFFNRATNTFVACGLGTFGSNGSGVSSARLQTTGTALVSGDFGFSGWGTGATIGSIAGSDSTFTFTITAGTTPSINPTVTLTYHDGPWVSVFSINPEWVGGTGNASDIQASSTQSVLTLTYLGLPVATKTYTLSVIVTGVATVIPATTFFNPVLQNPAAPQSISGFPLTIQNNLVVQGTTTLAGGTTSGAWTHSSLHTFNAGITGVGNIGALDLGATALATAHSWSQAQIFPDASISIQKLVPCADGQIILTAAGVQTCGSASVTNVNGSATSSPLNLGNLPIVQTNFILGVWQYSSGNASVEVPVSGNGSQACSTSGTLTVGHVVAFDVNGNCVDGGVVQETHQIGGLCTTGSSTYSFCSNTITWPTAFANNSYGVSCSGVGPSDPRANITISLHNTTSVTVNTVTYGSVSVNFSEIDCVGRHN